MKQRKKTNNLIFIIAFAAIISIVVIFLVDYWGNKNADRNLSALIETSKRDLHIKDRFTIEGYVGKSKHHVYIYIIPTGRYKTSPTDAAFFCSDIDSAQVWLLYPKNNKEKLEGAKYKLDVADNHFNEAFEVYCSSVEYAKQVFTHEIRQKILNNKEAIRGSWGLVRSRMTYIKNGIFNNGNEMDEIIDIGEVLIERMHDIANP